MYTLIQTEMVCLTPPPNVDIALMSWIPSWGSMAVGSSVTYVCNITGLWFQRDIYSQTSTCTSAGNWSAVSESSCVSK